MDEIKQENKRRELSEKKFMTRIRLSKQCRKETIK
jgi:hypothetical protein